MGQSEGNGTPLQYCCLENPMDRGAWWAAVHGVAKSQTRLSDFTWTFHFHALEKEMVTHSSVLAWRIPGMGEPGGLPSMGSHRVGLKWLSSSSNSNDKFKFHMYIVHTVKQWELFTDHSTAVGNSLCYEWDVETLWMPGRSVRTLWPVCWGPPSCLQLH